MRKLTLIALAVITLFSISCQEESENPDAGNNENTEVPNSLHMAFKTPDWERQIDCTLLDLFPFSVNDSTFAVNATSQSTSEAFYFSYPADSTDFVQSNNLKKYGITVYGANERYFQFSQKLPVTSGDADRLISLEGFSESEYNEVTEIKYVTSEKDYAVFQIKCRYAMNAYVLSNPDTHKPITGTFHLKVRTSHL